MKLLLNENISWRPIKPLSQVFDEVKHVNQISTNRLTDDEISQYAKNYGYTIVTFDTDFLNISIIRNHPPKVLLLRFGNLQIDLFINKITSKSELIHILEKSADNGILEIY